jgi:hypothetical protein
MGLRMLLVCGAHPAQRIAGFNVSEHRIVIDALLTQYTPDHLGVLELEGVVMAGSE